VRHDRDRFLKALHMRLGRAVGADGSVIRDVVLGREADAELQGLLRSIDAKTDMEARHAAGWLCALRAMAGTGVHGSVHGAMAGTLLFPVWVADPASVPEQFAAGFAAADPSTRPDPANADFPDAWWALCAASTIVAEGQQHSLPPDPSEDDIHLHEMAVRLAGMYPSRESALGTAVGAGSLAVLATWEYEPRLELRLETLARAVALAGTTWPFGDLADGDPVRFVRGAVKRAPAGSPARLLALDGLSRKLLERYMKSFDAEDLHEAVGIARDVVAQLPPDHPHLPSATGALGRSLMCLLQAEGATAQQCDEVVELCRRSFAGQPQSPAAAGHDLGMALVLRAQHTGRVADIDEAVRVLEEALRAARTPGEKAALQNALGNALRHRSVVTGAPADLDTALGLTGSGTAPGEAAGGAPSSFLVAPAAALYNRYLRDPQANGGDLDEALRLLQRAEAELPPGHPDRPAALNHLGLVRVARHQRSGSAEELNRAVAAHREAVAGTPDGHGLLGTRLLNLGAALSLRHQLTGDGEDLREARECRQRAATLPGLGRAHHAMLLSSTGMSLLTGLERAADPDTQLDQAIALLRQALALTPEGDPQLPRRRHRLAVALLSRPRTLRPGDAREARELADAVIAALPANSPDLPGALDIAATARAMSTRTLLSRAARREVIALYRRAVEATPPGDPKRTYRLCLLGSALHDLTPDPRHRRAALEEAAGLFREAALEEQCPPSERLEAARVWGDLRAEQGDWEQALEGYVVAVDLLHAVAPRHLVRDDQEFLLGRTAGLGAAAAACAVRCGRPGLAVGLLEQARGVILSHAFDADSDLTRLREAAPDLAARFEELRDALDTATDTRELPAEEELSAPGARADLRQRLAAEWRELTDRIRAEHPELGLLRPMRDWEESELRATAAAGPVVLVNVSPHGSDALIVTEHSIEALPLPDLDPRTTTTRRQTFQDALVRIETPGTSRKQSQRAQRDVRDTLAWLWRAVTGPVLDRLPAATRVWWSPGGLLGTLPLHAAAPADGAPGALDRVVSSYTPTLRALHHARRRAARPAGDGTLLVSVGHATGQAPLPGARREAEQLAGTLPGATLLADASATHSAVVSALRHHAHAHFACHALSDLEHPSGSRLVLHDHTERPLTVRDLARLRLPSVRLAYLSACATLRTSPELADEAVHIVSAFQMAGFPHVVGSLWHVDDVIGAEVALSVYRDLHAGGGTLDVARTAEALHRAVLALRDTYPQTPSLWACQVHAGP